jgi:serine/threonine protein kinase
MTIKKWRIGLLYLHPGRYGKTPARLSGGIFRKWLIEHADDVNARMTDGLEYIKMACAGVGAIHEADVTHLDLKAENLLFADNAVKVSDFGTSHCAQSLKQSSNGLETSS